jgi:hypothetical protein
MWIASLHASESSIEEGLLAFQAISESVEGFESGGAMIRHYAGPIVDLFHHGRGSHLRLMDSAPSRQGDKRWLQVTRWQIRPDGLQDLDRFESIIATLSPLMAPLIDEFEPLVFVAANPGDSTLALASQFASLARMEEAWQAMRRPGPLRDELERHLILTEFVSGEMIDLFAFNDWTDQSRASAISILAAE